MSTSAQSLNLLLSAIHTNKEVKRRFVAVAAEHLGFDDSDAEPNVVLTLHRLIGKIEADIELLPFDQQALAVAKRYVSPFLGLKNFSHIHLDIAGAKNSFLKPENLVGLTNLHMAMSGHVEYVEIGKDAGALAVKVDLLRDEILVSDLPDDLKRAFSKRLNQISCILNHYYAFGSKELASEVEALVGAIVLHAPVQKAKNSNVFKNIATVVVAVLAVLKTVDLGTTYAVGIFENSETLIGFLDVPEDDAE